MKNSIALLFVLTSASAAVKYPNDIEGSPVIECNRDAITIHVNTTNQVASKIFAKNHNEDSKCIVSHANVASFNLGSCGMNRKRELQPKGLAYSVVLIVQLHPRFITKVDRAYNVKCFYTESLNTVTAGLEVSMLSTDTVTGAGGAEGGGAVSSAVSPPQCTYSLHIDSPAGTTVKYAKIGDKVWHLWECPSEEYGMLIHSCFVADGQGNEFQILDRNGCGIDQYVLRTPEYSVTLNKAQQETHVFKFADKMVVLFNCQVKLCLKADNGCKGMTPPDCTNATGEGITGERLELSTDSFENSENLTKSLENNLSTESPEGGKTNETSESLSEKSTSGEIGEISTAEGATGVENSTLEGSGVERSENSTVNPEMETGINATENENSSTEHEGASNVTEIAEKSESKSNESSEATGPVNSSTEISESENSSTEKSAGGDNETATTVAEGEAGKNIKNDTSEGEKEARERRDAANKKSGGLGEKRNILMDSVDKRSGDLETDVSQKIWVLEPEETSPFEDASHKLSDKGDFDRSFESFHHREYNANEICLPTNKFSIVIAAGVFFLVLSTVLCLGFCVIVKRRNRSIGARDCDKTKFVRPIEPSPVFSLYETN